MAAKDNNIPFYVALPSSTFDVSLREGVREIPIEQRSGDEVTHMEGLNKNGQLETVQIVPGTSKAANYGFDVTPSRLITGFMTEKGMCAANEQSILYLHPDLVHAA